MRDKADIVFVSDKSILNTEFAGYNNIYTGDSKSVLDKRFEKKENVSDKKLLQKKKQKIYKKNN